MLFDEEECECPPKGLPAYMSTFADLMALLMCLFVLLLSFAEIDAIKFKHLAGSMRMAFGVQRVVEADQIPLGTSIIAQEFSPSRAEPTVINTVTQQSIDQVLKKLQVDSTRLSESAGLDKTDVLRKQLEKLFLQTRKDAIELANALSEQIAKNEVEIETQGREITVRIKEQGSFASGSASLQPGFNQVLYDVRDVLIDKPGNIHVQGHSDDVAISTARFRSNWELSSARAVSVAHALLSGGVLDSQRFIVSGFADNNPLKANIDPVSRAANRRVEIVIRQDITTELQAQLNHLKAKDPKRYHHVDSESFRRFNIRPDEVF
ncbi:MAG: type VI secretion system protein TssL [Cellvibrionales bacterium]|nr:type VI secretion system protein TssL [Cellvibrionales bacterium]|tara:strand:- start:2224 stop:3186 length:963 start_codon:yes stop_codon:yes gene_type:complete